MKKIVLALCRDCVIIYSPDLDIDRLRSFLNRLRLNYNEKREAGIVTHVIVLGRNHLDVLYNFLFAFAKEYDSYTVEVV